MRRIRQRLSEQAFGRSGITQPREHEVDRGAGGIDGSVEVAPTTFDTNIGLIDAPGPVGWFEMTAQPLLEFRTIALDPASDCRVIFLQAALAEPLFDITERERVPEVPAHGAKNQLGLGLSPLEDRWPDCLFHDRFRLPVAVGQSCNTTDERPPARRPFGRQRTLPVFTVKGAFPSFRIVCQRHPRTEHRDQRRKELSHRHPGRTP